jgi:PST family polysaccharide transporter
VSEKLLTLATYVVVSRSVEPEEFGIVVLVFLITEFLGQFSSFGVGENIVRKSESSELFLSSSFRFITYVSAALLLIMLFVASPLSYYFGGEKVATITLLMLFQPSLACFSGFYLGILQREFRFKEIAFRSTLISFASGGVGITLALLDFGILSMVAARYIYVLFDLLILQHFTRFQYKGNASKKQLYEIWHFGWKLSFAQVFNFSSNKIYELFVTSFFGLVGLGLVDVGRKFIVTIYRITLTPLSTVCLSYISRHSNPIDAYVKFVRMVLLCIVPVIALLGCFSTDVIEFFNGQKWSNSSDILNIFSFGVVVQVPLWFTPSLLIKAGTSLHVVFFNVINFTVMVIGGVICLYVLKLDLVSFIFAMMLVLFLSYFVRTLYVCYVLRTSSIPFFGLFLLAVVVFSVFYLSAPVVAEFLRHSLQSYGYEDPGFFVVIAVGILYVLIYFPSLVWVYKKHLTLDSVV